MNHKLTFLLAVLMCCSLLLAALAPAMAAEEWTQKANAVGEPTPEELAQLNESATAAKTAYENAVRTALAAGLEIDADGLAYLPEELDDHADLIQLGALIGAIKASKAAWDAAIKQAEALGVEIVYIKDYEPAQASPAEEPAPDEQDKTEQTIIEAANAARSAYESALRSAQAAGLEIDADGYAHLPAELDEQADPMQLQALIESIKAFKAAWDAAIKQAEALGVEIVYDEDYEPAPARPDEEPGDATEEPVVEPVDDPAEPVADPFRFDDVKDDKSFYFEPVYWAVEQKITKGTSEKLFSPNDSCTRAQVVTFLWRAAGEPEPAETVNPFQDVKADAYYSKAVLWAVEKGVTKGTSADAFSPEATCTRAQIVTFLYRASGAPEVSRKSKPFTDVDAAQYYADAVAWAVEHGITTGKSPEPFAPEATCTRAEVVTFLYRAGKA